MASDVEALAEHLGLGALIVAGHDRGAYVALRLALGRELEARMGSEAYAEYVAVITDPATVRAMLEDYRAGLGVDYEDEAADRAVGAGVTCPGQVLWAGRDDLADLYDDPLALWGPWADDLRGRAIDCGHHLAEEAPHELVDALVGFADESRREHPAKSGRVPGAEMR